MPADFGNALLEEINLFSVANFTSVYFAYVDPYLTAYCDILFCCSKMNIRCKKTGNVDLLQTGVQVFLKFKLSAHPPSPRIADFLNTTVEKLMKRIILIFTA